MAEAAERVAIDIRTTADVSGAQKTTTAVKEVGDATKAAMAQSEAATLRFNTALAVTNDEAQMLSHSALIGFAELSRGMAKVAQAGEVGAFAMREFTGAAFRLGAFLGPGGEFLPIIGLVGYALVEAFKGGEDESEKMRKQFESDLAKMVDAVDQSGLEKKLRSLEIGDPSKGLGQGGGYKASIRDLVAQINDVAAQYDRLANLIDEGTGKKVTEEDTWIGRATRLQLTALQKHYNALEAELKPLRAQQGELYNALLNPEVLPGMQREPKGLGATTIKADSTDAAARKYAEAMKKAWQDAAFFAANDLENNDVFARKVIAPFVNMLKKEGLWTEVGKELDDTLKRVFAHSLDDETTTQSAMQTAVAHALKGLDNLASKGPLVGSFTNSLGKELKGLTDQTAHLDEMMGTLAGSTIPALASGFLAMFGAIQSHTPVFKAFAQVATSAIAEVAAKMAAEQFAEGLAMVAASIWDFLGPNPVAGASAAKHFEAAALFGAIAAAGAAGSGAIGGGGGGSSGGGGGYGGGQFVPSSQQPSGNETIVIHVGDVSNPALVNTLIYEVNRSGILGKPVVAPYGRPS